MIAGGDGSTRETGIVMPDEGENVVRDEYFPFRRAGEFPSARFNRTSL